MSENKSKWNNNYAKMGIKEQLFDNKQSPENFIDDIKMEYLLPYLPKEGVIVEVGAGSGRLLTRVGINVSECKLVGVDYSHYSTIVIRENLLKFNLNGTAICADAFHIPLKDGSSDMIISGGLLEHFNEDKIDDVIQEMVRVLKPNGLFYADIAPKKKSLLRPIILKEIGGYENLFTKEEWHNIFKRNMLDNIKIFSALVVPPNFYGFFRSGLRLRIIYKLKSIIKTLDNTFLSDIFGFEYIVLCRKDELPPYKSGGLLCPSTPRYKSNE